MRNTTVSKSAILINTQTSSNNNVMQYQLIVYVSSHVMKTSTLSAKFLDHSLQTLEMKCTEIPVDQQFLKSLKSPSFPILMFGLNFSRYHLDHVCMPKCIELSSKTPNLLLIVVVRKLLGLGIV